MPYLSYPGQRFAWPTDTVASFEVSPARVGSHLAYVAAVFGQGDTAQRLAAEAQAAGDAGVQLELALAATRPDGDLRGTNDHLEAAWKLEPDNVEVLVRYASWLLRTARDAREDYARKYRKRALKLGTEAATTAPDSVAGHFVVGMASRELGSHRLPSAIASLQRAHALAPAHDGVTLELGLALADAGERVQAMELLVRVARRQHRSSLGRQAREALAALQGPG